jgi:aquaglyceroporin related protein
MQAGYMTNVSAFFSEFLATAILVASIFAMSDRWNTAPPTGLGPLLLFILLAGISISLGMDTGMF